MLLSILIACDRLAASAMLSPSFSCVYLCVAITSSVVFVWLSITGPPPPTADDINLPHQSEIPSMIMGSKTYGFWTKEAQNAWDNMLPSNGGVVVATNLTTGFHYWAMPAMFHQLKCLRDIRKRFASMASTWDEEFGQVHGHNGEYERLSSCFDLIRQVCRCSFRLYNKRTC